VLKSFYNHKNSFLLSEVAGSSSAVVEVATDFRPLTDLLFLISGNKTTRARVLTWIMGQGLMRASFAREKLLQEVKKVAASLDSIDNAKLPPKSVGDGRKSVGMRMEHARFSNFGSFYGKDADDLDIDSMDLFSPESYEKISILKLIDQEKKMDKKSIFEYWLEKYEPKKCLINQSDTKNRHFVYDFEEIRKAALDLGLKPFYFGGFNGLIQFIEKGDWKSDVEKKANLFARNDHFGVDLRPEFHKDKNGSIIEDKKGNRLIKSDLISFDEDGKGKKPIYHFEGGAFISDDHRSTQIVNRLNNHFSDLSAAVQRNEFKHSDVKDYDPIIGYDLRDLKSKSDTEDVEDVVILGDTRFANALGFDNPTGGSQWKKLPNLTKSSQEKWKDIFKKILVTGLQIPLKKEQKTTDGYDLYKKTFENEKFSGDKEDYDGWFSYFNNSFIFKLNKKQQEEVFNAVTSRLDNNEYLSRVQLKDIPSLKNLAIKKDESIDHNLRLSINIIINNALKSNPDLRKEISVYVPSLKKDLSQVRDKFEFVANDERIDLENVNPVNPDQDDLNNPTIKELFKKGFRWKSSSNTPFKGLIEKLNSPEKQITADPDSKSPDMGSPEIKNLMGDGFKWEDIVAFHPFAGYKKYSSTITKKRLVKDSDRYEVIFNKKENKFYLKPILKSYFSLTNGPDSYKVSLERDENNVLKFYLYKPSFEDNSISLKPRSIFASPRSKSHLYPFVGSKDIMFKGGNKTGHFTGIVAGPQDWQILLQRLKQGRKGGLHEFEKEDPSDRTYDELNLPSVIGGVALAKQWFNSQKGGESKRISMLGSQLGGNGGKYVSDWFDYTELLTWGLEGLKQFSGTRWFQIGWISDNELKHYIGNYHSKGGNKKTSDDIDSEEEYYKQLAKMYGESFSDSMRDMSSRLRGGGGLGLKPKLLKHGAIGNPDDGETPEQRDAYIKSTEEEIEYFQKNYSQLRSKDKGKIFIDFIRKDIPAETVNALAENGFEVRKRMVGKYVLEKMNRRLGELNNNEKIAFSGVFGGGYDDEQGGYDHDADNRITRSSGSTYDTERQRVSASDLPSGEIVSPEIKSRVVGKTKKVKKNSQASSSFSWPDDPRAVPEKTAQVSQQPAQSSLVAPQASSSFSWPDDPRAVPEKTAQGVKKENFNINLLNYSAWKKIQETIGTYAIVSKKPKDGDGYNIWGSLGDINGVSITGDADTSKIDPIGKKGNKIVKRKR
jgi:hypothetical protein